MHLGRGLRFFFFLLLRVLQNNIALVIREISEKTNLFSFYIIYIVSVNQACPLDKFWWYNICMNQQLNYGRALMGDSLGFHILFALLGVGIPFLISLFELIGILKKDSDYYAAAKRWSFALGTLFVVGAVSGTIISTQLNTLWPNFMTVAGKVIGLPFFLEGFAFFIETIFSPTTFSWNYYF